MVDQEAQQTLEAQKTDVRHRIRFLMENRKFTQQALGDLLEITKQGVNNLIHGKSLPSFDVVYAILKNFPEVSERWFIMGEGPVFRTPPTYNQDNRIGYVGESEAEYATRAELRLAQTRIESLERENQVLRDMVDVLKKANKG